MTNVEYPEIGSLEEATKAVRKIVNDLFRRNLLPNSSPALVDAMNQIEAARAHQIMQARMASIDQLREQVGALELYAEEYRLGMPKMLERQYLGEQRITVLEEKVRSLATAPVAQARKRAPPRAKKRGKGGRAKRR